MATGEGLQEVHTNFTFKFDGDKLAAVERGVKRSVTGLNTIAQQTDIFQQKMGGFFARAKGVIGAYLGFRAVKTLTTDYAQGADMIAKFASGLGISAQQYQRMTHAAQLSGITVDELNMAIPKLAKSAGDAADGSKAMALAFKRANVSIRDTSGKIKDPITLLTELGDGLKKVDGKFSKTQILMNIFGRAGKKMGVLLDQGSDGIKAAMAEADKLGIVLSNKQLKDAENFNDEMLRAKSVFIGVRNTIASALLPAITDQIRAFHVWWREGDNAERAMRALKITAIFTGAVIARMIGAKIIRGLMSFVQGIIAGTRALMAMNFQLVAAQIKILLIVAGVLLVVGIIEDFVGFMQGKDSVIGRLLGDTGQAAAIKEAVLSIGREIKKVWAEIAPALLDAWNEVKPALQEMGTALKPIAGVALRIALGLVVAGFHGIAWAVRNSAGAITIMSKVIEGLGVYLKHLVAGFKPVLNMLNAVISAANKAGYAISLITGNVELSSQIREQWQTKGGRSFESFGKVGTKGFGGRQAAIDEALEIMLDRGEMIPSRIPQSLMPPPRNMTPNATANVAAGAITVNVAASGDPDQIAASVSEQLGISINEVFTNASRDLVKPPAGQR